MKNIGIGLSLWEIQSKNHNLTFYFFLKKYIISDYTGSLYLYMKI